MICIIYVILFSIIIIFIPVVANETLPVVVLQQRLEKINDFYAHFVQKIVNVDNNVLLESYGELWVKPPNLFHWHMQSPEENFLISDGNTLWFYIPAIKQVTAYRLRDISCNIFFVLFSDAQKNKWGKYHIQQQGDCFSIKPIHNNNDDVDSREYKVNITDCGIIKNFSCFERTEQYVDYSLLDYKHDIIDTEKFCFVLSADIQLDDQRK